MACFPRGDASALLSGLSSFADLETLYEQKYLDILKAQGSSYIVWQEIFDNGAKILPDTVVEVWKGGNWQEDMAAVTYDSSSNIGLPCLLPARTPVPRPSPQNLVYFNFFNINSFRQAVLLRSFFLLPYMFVAFFRARSCDTVSSPWLPPPRPRFPNLPFSLSLCTQQVSKAGFHSVLSAPCTKCALF